MRLIHSCCKAGTNNEPADRSLWKALCNSHGQRPPEFISSWGKHVDFIRFYFETCPYKRVTGLIWLGKLTFKALNTLASSGLMVPTPDMGSDPLMETR